MGTSPLARDLLILVSSLGVIGGVTVALRALTHVSPTTAEHVLRDLGGGEQR